MFTAKRNPFTRFLTGTVRSISFASQAQRIAHTPEDIFLARGTTREQAIRDLLDRL